MQADDDEKEEEEKRGQWQGAVYKQQENREETW